MEIGDILFIVFSAMFGLAVGSFLNVCIYRVPKKIFFTEKHSFCPQCGAKLRWYDMVPVFSWIVLLGKCRSCKGRISPRYPAVELLTGVLWLLSAYYFGAGTGVSIVNALIFDIVFAALIVMTFIDLDTKEIPNGIVLLLIVLSIPLFFTMPEVIWWQRLAGAAVISVPLYLIALLSGGGIGGGDIKLFFALGLILGLWHTLIAAFLAIVAAGIVGGVLLATKKVKKGYELPLGPFIALGTIITMFLGNNIVGLIRGVFGM